jgi:hypothetical protein
MGTRAFMFDDLGRRRYDDNGFLIPAFQRGRENIGFANFYNDVQRGRVGAGNTEYGNVKAYRMYIGNQKSHTYDDDSNDNWLGEVSIKPLYRYFYKYEGNFGDGRALDRLQNSLDVIGVFDPFGIADFVNTTIHLARGNYKEALYSGISILPLGDLIKLRKGGKIVNEAIEEGTTGFRYMTEGELKAIQQSGMLRGGNPGKTYFTKDLYKSGAQAQQRLSLPTTPTLRVEFEILNNPTMRLNGSKVLPDFGMPGKGAEFMTTDPVKVRLINWQPLR